jgi:hypothetical protein
MNLTAFNYQWDYWEVTKKVTFDGDNRLIIVNDGVTSLDIRSDVYSRWVDWRDLYGNMAYTMAMRYTGLDDIPGGQTGDTYFLTNGWKLIVDLRKVRITGILYSDDYETAYYDALTLDAVYPATVAALVNTVTTKENVVTGVVPTLSEIAGAVWNAIQSEYLQAGSTGERLFNAGAAGTPPTAAEVANAVWDKPYTENQSDDTFGHLVGYINYMDKTVYVDEEALAGGDGSQEHPFENITDAMDYAESHGITKIAVRGDVQLGKQLKNIAIYGVGVPEVDANGQNLKNSEFHRIKFKGNYIESIIVQESVLLNGAFLNGFFENCAVAGNVSTVANSSAYVKNCASMLPNGFAPTFTIASNSTLNLVEWYGKGIISGCSSPTASVIINLVSGDITIDSSCTEGTILITGTGNVIDNSAGATIINSTINDSVENITVTLPSIINSNVVQVNGYNVTGSGQSGNEWGPA